MKIENLNVRALQRNAQQEIDAQLKMRAAHDTDYSIAALVRSKMRGTDTFIDRRAIDLGYELSENMRQRGGAAPTGFFVPLGMLTRGTLTSASDAGLTAAYSNSKFVSNSIQSALLPDSGIFASATILTGVSGADLQLIAVDSVGTTTGAFPGEVGAAPEIDPSFKNTTLTPVNLRFKITVSKLSLMKANGALDDALRREMASKAVSLIENTVLNGAGGNEAVGLLNNPGISVLAAGNNGLAPTWGHVVECEYDAATRNARGQSSVFLCSPKLRKKLRNTQRGSGLDYILPSSARELMGYPLVVSTQSPDNLDKGTSTGVCSSLLFGDMSEVFIAFYGPAAIDVFVDDVTLAAEGKVRLICSALVGVGVRRISAFSCYKDLLAS